MILFSSLVTQANLCFRSCCALWPGFGREFTTMMIADGSDGSPQRLRARGRKASSSKRGHNKLAMADAGLSHNFARLLKLA